MTARASLTPIPGLHEGRQTARVAQVAVRHPFDEFGLRHQFRVSQTAFVHLRRRQPHSFWSASVHIAMNGTVHIIIVSTFGQSTTVTSLTIIRLVKKHRNRPRIGMSAPDFSPYLPAPRRIRTGSRVMARVALVSVEQPAAGQICHALAVTGHQIVRYPDQDNVIAFGCGYRVCERPAGCLSASVRARAGMRPTMPFIVVARIPETSE